MDIRVHGGQVISGELHPSGSKNSAVALLPATLMFDAPVTLQNIPDISDVRRLIDIMKKLGSKISWDEKEKVMVVDNSSVRFQKLDKDDLGNMKGTSLLWGPMLARFKKVEFANLPGGCTLGFRTLGPHYKAFEELGVRVVASNASASMDASKAKATTVWLRQMSPTATENALMLASGLPGITKLIGAASEPQVQDLCLFLVAAGVQIRGIGSSILEIEGVERLSPVVHRILPDHYEITTFAALAAATGGGITIHDVIPEYVEPMRYEFSRFGVDLEYGPNNTAIVKPNQKIKLDAPPGRPLIVKAQPWPALPVDTLPMYIPLALAAKQGQVIFHNWMYDAGLFWTSELHKLGANITMCDPHRIIVNAGNPLVGAKLEAPYIIRAVVAMVVSAMIAKGESMILDADALYRGHPFFAENLKRLGAKIEEVTEFSR